MRRAKIAIFLLSAIPFCAGAQASPKSCETVECGVETRAVTYATQQEPFYACPTRALSDYTNTLAVMARVRASVEGKAPAAFAPSSEPPNQRQSQEALQAQAAGHPAGGAGVEQAFSACGEGRHQLQVVVRDNPSDSQAIFVETRDKKHFWMPKAHLYRR